MKYPTPEEFKKDLQENFPEVWADNYWDWYEQLYTRCEYVERLLKRLENIDPIMRKVIDDPVEKGRK